MGSKKNVTFVGLGTMGYPMAGHLSNSGLFNVCVFNRSLEKSAKWGGEYQGRVAQTIEEAVSDADVIITCTGRDEDMMEIVFSDDGMLPFLKSGSIFIDHTTTSCKLAKHLDESLKSKDINFIDAPVSGGEAGAVNGVLSVMAGGDPAILESCDSIMRTYSKSVTLMGEAGSGQLAKMVNQICIAGMVQGLSEAINFGINAKLNMKEVIEVISKGAAQSWQMENRHKTMIDDKFDYGFAVDWMRKDLKIAMEEAKRNNSPLPITKIINEYYGEVQKMGGNRWDTSSLIKRFRK